jgi:hypothetical protein
MERMVLICGAVWWLSAGALAQTDGGRFAFVFASAPPAGSSEVAPDDPGYALYREGYAKVLNEEWDAARKLFDELRAKHPGSHYIDDAAYWYAYALMHTNRREAIASYREFIRQHPRSSYTDDAVADLMELRSWDIDLDLALPPGGAGRDPAAPEAPGKHELALQAALAKQERMLKRQQEELERFALIAPHVMVRPRVPVAEPLPPAVQLKIEALRGLAQSPHDPAAFERLRVIAIDGHQPEPVREVAIASAARFTDPQVLPFLVNIVRTDTNQDLQVLAIDLIGEHRAGKDTRIESLIDLYHDIPRDRTAQRRAIFYSIAAIGSDRAVDFLKTVAASDEQYDLRREAVFYLGGIGTERARSALFDILKEK